jgi:drug/metabolite transporter (DMT)-like permease
MELSTGGHPLRALLNQLSPWLVWGLFFASSVFGHVALKRGAGAGTGYDFRTATTVFLTPWGISALLSWGLSCWLWAVILTRHSLFAANSVSTLRYVLICLAAFYFLKESFGFRELAGMLLITSGVWILSR